MAGVFTVNSSPQSIKTRGWRNNARMFVEPKIDVSDLMRCEHNRAFKPGAHGPKGIKLEPKLKFNGKTERYRYDMQAL